MRKRILQQLARHVVRGDNKDRDAIFRPSKRLGHPTASKTVNRTCSGDAERNLSRCPSQDQRDPTCRNVPNNNGLMNHLQYISIVNPNPAAHETLGNIYKFQMTRSSYLQAFPPQEAGVSAVLSGTNRDHVLLNSLPGCTLNSRHGSRFLRRRTEVLKPLLLRLKLSWHRTH